MANMHSIIKRGGLHSIPIPLPPVTTNLIGMYIYGEKMTRDASSAISAWGDLSGSGNNLTQITGALQPVDSGIDIDFLNKIMEYPFSLNVGAMSAFSVARDSGSGRNQVIAARDGDGQTYKRMTVLIQNGTPSVARAYKNTSNAGSGNTIETAYNIIGGVYTASDVSVFLNGAKSTTLKTASTIYTDIVIGQQFYEGGEVKAVLVYDRAVNDTEAGQINTYLNDMYNVY